VIFRRGFAGVEEEPLGCEPTRRNLADGWGEPERSVVEVVVWGRVHDRVVASPRRSARSLEYRKGLGPEDLAHDVAEGGIRLKIGNGGRTCTRKTATAEFDDRAEEIRTSQGKTQRKERMGGGGSGIHSARTKGATEAEV